MCVEKKGEGMSEDELLMFKMIHEENKAIAQMLCAKEKKIKVSDAFNTFWEETVKIVGETEDVCENENVDSE
jgi:hypothetical protein